MTERVKELGSMVTTYLGIKAKVQNFEVKTTNSQWCVCPVQMPHKSDNDVDGEYKQRLKLHR